MKQNRKKEDGSKYDWREWMNEWMNDKKVKENETKLESYKLRKKERKKERKRIVWKKEKEKSQYTKLNITSNEWMKVR